MAGVFRVLELLGLGVLIGVRDGLIVSLDSSSAAVEVLASIEVKLDSSLGASEVGEIM